MEFPFGGMTFQCLHLTSLDKVQLWFRWRSRDWQCGHAKPIPEGMDAASVANLMRQFIVGEISHDEYNRLLPN